jgi:hypothetical protein
MPLAAQEHTDGTPVGSVSHFTKRRKHVCRCGLHGDVCRQAYTEQLRPIYAVWLDLLRQSVEGK